MKPIIDEFVALLNKHSEAILKHGKATGLRTKASILRSFFVAVAFEWEHPNLAIILRSATTPKR